MYRKSKFRFLWLGMAACLFALALPSLVFAGGWAVVTLDALPQNITAGQPLVIGMTARQHGQTPWELEALILEARHQETGHEVSFAAKPDGKPGHYQVELLFPEAGRWEWGVASGLVPVLQPLPVLEVAGGAGVTAVSQKPSPLNALQRVRPPAALLGILALSVLAAGVVLVIRSRDNRRRWLAGTGSLVLCGALAFAMFAYTSAQAQPEPSAIAVSTDAETGRQLFLAKGCVVCHTNERAIAISAQYGFDIGPNLTKYRNEPSYLHAFLANPQAVNEILKPKLGI